MVRDTFNMGIQKLDKTDWDLVTNEDGTINLLDFLSMVQVRLNIALVKEQDFATSFAIIQSLEELLGPFNKDQAISIAIMYALAK